MQPLVTVRRRCKIRKDELKYPGKVSVLPGPKEEEVCEQSESGDILSLDKKGNIIGFEKINFFPQEFIDVFNKLPRKDYEGRLLAVEKR